jgi:glycosyl transferase family 25
MLHPRCRPHRLETPVVIINLDRSTHRRSQIEAQLTALDVPFHRLAATDGHALGESERNRHYNDALNRRCYHKPLVAGEIGCYISHLRAWQWLLDSGFERAVILEDDVVLGENFQAALDLLPCLPQPWDIVKLGSWSRKPVLSAVAFGQFSLHRYGKTPISAFAQAVSRRGAEKLLRARVPFARPVDVDLQHVWETDLEVCGLEPYPVDVVLGVSSDICRSEQRNKVRSNRLAFFRQRLGFAVRQWRHNLGRHGLRPLMRTML